MSITNPMEKLGIHGVSWHVAPGIGPLVILAVTAVAALGVLLRFGQGLQNDLVLPMLSTAFFALAAAVAVFGWRRPRKSPRFTYWDLAGVFTLIGVCIAAAVEPEQMVRLVAGENRQP